MRSISLVLCAAFALTPLAASAATTAAPAGGKVTQDARCLLTMAALSSAKDEARSRAAQAGVIYFAGRVKAQDPNFDFSTRLKAIAATLNGEALAAEAQRCGPILMDTLRGLDAAQKTLGGPKPAAAPAAPAAKP